MIYEDGKCNAKDAASAGNKLINVDKVKYIIGGSCSGETLAITDLAESKKVIMLSPLSSSPDITNAGDYIFRDYVNDNDAGKKVTKEMYKAGIRKAALLNSLNDYSEGLASVFAKEFKKLGGEVVITESFAQGTTDFRSMISKIKAKKADGVVVFEYTTGLVAFFKQKEELGLEALIYGADTFSDPAIIEGVGAAFDGVRYVVLKDSASNDFKTKLALKAGRDDLTVGSPNAYDAVYILANAINAVGDDSTKVKEWLYQMPTYEGESGSIKFDSNGDLVSAEFSLYEVKDGQPVVVG